MRFTHAASTCRLYGERSRTLLRNVVSNLRLRSFQWRDALSITRAARSCVVSSGSIWLLIRLALLPAHEAGYEVGHVARVALPERAVKLARQRFGDRVDGRLHVVEADHERIGFAFCARLRRHDRVYRVLDLRRLRRVQIGASSRLLRRLPGFAHLGFPLPLGVAKQAIQR